MNKKHKKLKSAFFVWMFFNLYALIAGIAERGAFFKIPEEYTFYNENAGDLFFPNDTTGTFMAYDISEFFLYVGLPVLIYGLYRYNKGTTLSH